MLWRHLASDGHPRVLSTGLLLLSQILVVGHLLLLLIGHIAWMHAPWSRDVRLRSIHIVVVHILGGIGGHVGGINSILVARGLGGIEACLSQVSSVPGREGHLPSVCHIPE